MPRAADCYETTLLAVGCPVLQELPRGDGRRALAGVRLRVPLRADASALLRLFEDSEVSRYFLWSPPRTLGQTEFYVQGFQRDILRGTAHHFAILVLPEEQPAGIINLFHFERQRRPPQAELGIWLGREYWGTGVGLAACRLVLDFAFRTLDFAEVVFLVRAENGRARRAFEKLGAAESGWDNVPCQRTRRSIPHLVYRMVRPAAD